MQTLADIRAAAKAGKLKPHVVTSTATPTSTMKPASSTKTDPLAALRAQVKAGKLKSTPPAPRPIARAAMKTQVEIENLFKDNEGVSTQAALTAVYKAGYADGRASVPST